jgi:hypothetical protein
VEVRGWPCSLRSSAAARRRGTGDFKMDRQRLGQRLKFLANIGVSLEGQNAGFGRVDEERKREALQVARHLVHLSLLVPMLQVTG